MSYSEFQNSFPTSKMSHVYRNYIFQPKYPFDPFGVVHDTSLYSYCYKLLNPLGSRIFGVSSLCYKYLNPSGSLMVGDSSAIFIPIEQIFFFELNLKYLEEINIFFFKRSLSMMLFLILNILNDIIQC